MMFMDVRQVMIRDRRTRDALFGELSNVREAFGELSNVRGADIRFHAYVSQVARIADAACEDEYLARPATEAMARALQGAR